MVQGLVSRGRFGRNNGEVSTSKGVGKQTTCESDGGTRKSEGQNFSPLWEDHLQLDDCLTTGLRDKGSRYLSSRDSLSKCVEQKVENDRCCDAADVG
jgi:hypothetical protein